MKPGLGSWAANQEAFAEKQTTTLVEPAWQCLGPGPQPAPLGSGCPGQLILTSRVQVRLCGEAGEQPERKAGRRRSAPCLSLIGQSRSPPRPKLVCVCRGGGGAGVILQGHKPRDGDTTERSEVLSPTVNVPSGKPCPQAVHVEPGDWPPGPWEPPGSHTLLSTWWLGSRLCV